jgi:hypothetical protein
MLSMGFSEAAKMPSNKTLHGNAIDVVTIIATASKQEFSIVDHVTGTADLCERDY